MTPARDPKQKKYDKSFKIWVFWAENPRKFSGFFRRSFCEGRELRRPKYHVHPAFYVFPIFDPPKNSWKSKVSPPPSKPLPLGPCPDDRAQNSVQDSINESSVRPNPTLVFAKILFQFCHLDRSWEIQDRSWKIQDRSWKNQDRSWKNQDRSWKIQDRSW